MPRAGPCYTRTMRVTLPATPARWILASILLAFPAGAAQKLVVISVSGLDFRYLKDADRLHLKIPVLRKLMAQGALADGVTGFPPANSTAATITLVTGVPPFRHGVTEHGQTSEDSNSLTLWQSATKAHRKVAGIFWPGMTAADVNFACPEIRPIPFSGNIPFEPVADRCTHGLVDRVASANPSFRKSIWNDETAMAGLAYLLQYEQPDLSLVQLTDLAEEQRETGALSLYSRDLLENDDELLGRMISRLPAHTLIAIVSDHAFETEQHIVRPRVLVNSLSADVRYGLVGTSDPRVAAALRRQIGIRGTGIAREVPISEVRLYAPELTRWVAAFGTLPGYIANEESKGPAIGQGNHKGVDNLWPTRPNFRSVFLLWGEGIKSVHLGEISILQIAPTLASAISLTLPSAQQASLWPKLTK
jgi:hypothetical protein